MSAGSVQVCVYMGMGVLQVRFSMRCRTQRMHKPKVPSLFPNEPTVRRQLQKQRHR